MLISACEFLQDVVFHDFPAEVFLQRPNIVQVIKIIYFCDGKQCFIVGDV